MAEVMFRDGLREVPEHVEAMFRQYEVEPVRYTYREAVDLANSRMAHEPFRKALEGTRRDHFRRFPS